MIAAIPFPTWLRPEIIPNLPFRWYGLMYLLAFAVAYLLVRYQVKVGNLPYSEDDVSSFFFWGILGLLAGARIFASLVYDTTGVYREKPWLIFWPFDDSGRFVGIQGMSYHGGLIGGILAVTIYALIKKIDLVEWMDLAFAAVPLGYTFGRLGNFINGELYGKVCSSPIGMIFPRAEAFKAKEPWVLEVAERVGISVPNMNASINLPRYPSQLFEAAFEGLVLWAFLWFVARKLKPFKGFVTGCYLIGYGLVRFVIEYFREPDPGIGYVLKLGDPEAPIYLFTTPLNFSMGQVLCLLMIAGGALFLFFAKRREDRLAAAEELRTRTARERPDGRKLRKRTGKHQYRGDR
jgi:phosphatidylglycerol---prolipoprotein diacylglyceryl transferase